MDPCVDYTIRSFEYNRKIVEDNLRDLQQYIKSIPRSRPLWQQLSGVAWLRRWYETRILVHNYKELRRRRQIYRQVEQRLSSGDLSLAIKALSEFCPESESSRDIIRRIYRDHSLSPLLAVSCSPSILRENMLGLRDKLIVIQKESPA